MGRLWGAWKLWAGVCLILVSVTLCGGTGSEHGQEGHPEGHEQEEEENDQEMVPSCRPLRRDESSELTVLADNLIYYGPAIAGATFNLTYNGTFLCGDGKPPKGVVDPREFMLTTKGHLGVRGCNEGVGKLVYSWFYHDEYCINPTKDGFIESVRYCKEEAPPGGGASDQNLLTRPMLKCCSPGFAVTFDGRNYKCVGLDHNDVDWSPTYYDSTTVNKHRCLAVSEKRIRTRLQTRVNRRDNEKFLCPSHDYKARASYPGGDGQGFRLRSRWRLLDNGTQIEYHLPLHGRLLWGTWSKVVDEDHTRGGDNVWCYDKFIIFSPEDPERVVETSEVAYHLSTAPNIHEHYECGPLAANVSKGAWPGVEEKAAAVGCNYDHADEKGVGWVTDLYIAMFIMALVPLMLTLIAYWLTWSSQNLHGWTVFSHILSVFCMNLFLAVAMLIAVKVGEVQRGLKIFLGVSAHFFTLATFMWLTMINFDLWWTFRKLKSSQMQKGYDRFAVFSVFAWGIPVIFVTVGLVMDSRFGDFGYDSDCDIRIPMYGRNFVLARSAEGIYLYFPLAVLMVMNMVFFFSTCTKIYSPKCKRKGMLHKQAGLDRQSVELFLKLFVVMGCTLTADAIAWSIMPDTESLEDFPWSVICFDAFNILGRAFFIFIIFACKPQVWARVEKMLVPGSSSRRSTTRRPSSSGKFSTQDTTDRDQSRIKMHVMA